MQRIAINGLGRIGRCLVRALFENNYSNLELVAINSPGDIEVLAHLLKYDSIHGRFKYEVSFVDDTLIIDDKKIKVFHEESVGKVPWKDLQIDIVLESSGRFNNRRSAGEHIKSGAKKVIVSAPCANADATIVCGVNDQLLTKDLQVISAGSCTTNALAPLAKVINDTIGIESGFMTTIHAYTNDQNLMDKSHKDIRRARAASLSMIPTSTGAAKTIGLVIPELNGKLDGSSIRVPVSNVSMIDLSFVAKKDISVEKINNIFKEASLTMDMRGILSIAPAALVSIDFNHDSHSAIFDPYETKVVNALGRVVAWYDNEWAFSRRMLDIASRLELLA